MIANERYVDNGLWISHRRLEAMRDQAALRAHHLPGLNIIEAARSGAELPRTGYLASLVLGTTARLQVLPFGRGLQVETVDDDTAKLRLVAADIDLELTPGLASMLNRHRYVQTYADLGREERVVNLGDHAERHGDAEMMTARVVADPHDLGHFLDVAGQYMGLGHDAQASYAGGVAALCTVIRPEHDLYVLQSPFAN